MKKIRSLYLLPILLAFLITPAQTAQLFSSWAVTEKRIGLGLAAEYMCSDAYLKVASPYTFGANLQSTQSQTGKNLQLAPCIELGGTFFENYYLGLLVSWRYSGPHKPSRSPLKGTYYFLQDFKINHYFDLLLKSGYKIAPHLMGYGLIGPSIANWSHTTDIFNDQVRTERFRMNKTNVGLALGFGFEYTLQRKYAFSVDYIHHFSKSVSKSQYMTYMDNIGGVPALRYGNVLKTVTPTYATIAIRLTIFFL